VMRGEMEEEAAYFFLPEPAETQRIIDLLYSVKRIPLM